jgi:DNA-directed RNA polymerase subunit RPC12/RpoP
MSFAFEIMYGLNFAVKFHPEVVPTSDAGPNEPKESMGRRCPKCRARIMLRARVGQRVMCPECKSMFVAEAA